MTHRFRLCCLTKNKTNPAYEGARIGADRLAASLGSEVMHFTPDVPDDLSEQEAHLDEVLRIKPDALLISPIDARALDDRLQQVRAAGIPLFYFVTCSDAVPAETFVTSDNRTLADGIARHLFDHLGGAGNVVILEGSAQSPTSAPRTRGFLDGAKAYPGIKVVASRAGNYQLADGRRAMAEMLDAHGHIDGVLAANDYMAFGALEALGAAGRRATVVGINAMPDAITAVRDGRLLATVGFDAMSMTCLAVHAAVRFLSGEKVPKVVEMPGDVVHAGNCDAWDKPYAERLLPEWDLAWRYDVTGNSA